ncbi:MAG: helix-hairpin-helix domain-containing protein [Chloroflexi bacterium]|nr:MAG: helix-hairpin-helix domain-containing protein [Chloroflexota bacterium]
MEAAGHAGRTHRAGACICGRRLPVQLRGLGRHAAARARPRTGHPRPTRPAGARHRRGRESRSLPLAARRAFKVAFAKTSSGTIVVRINLNQATLEELQSVPGFTPAFAEECIDYRTNFGGFQNTRELVEILGMSEADYVIARRYLTL